MKTFIKPALLCIALLYSLGLYSQNYNLPYQSSQQITTNSGNVYDNGGPSGDYQDSSNDILVIYPDSADMKIALIFSQFSVETCCDGLTIYDGPSTAYQSLGTFISSPGFVYSTHETGALTLQFYSDGSVTESGFAAEISLLDSIPDEEVRFTSSYLERDSAMAGEPIYYNYQIQNTGQVSVSSVYIKYYLSTDAEFDALDDSIGYYYRSYVSPGQNYYCSGNFYLPLDAPSGDYYILARLVDSDDNYLGDEEDCLISHPFEVIATEIDLTIPRVFMTPNVIYSDDYTSISYEISNEGNMTVNNAMVGFYLSTDMIIDSADYQLTSDFSNSIGINQVRSKSHSFTIYNSSGLESGIYYLLINADDEDAVLETDESNNVTAIQVLYSKTTESENEADLSLTGLSVLTDTITVGNTLGINYEITSNSYLYGTTTAFFISSDETLDPSDLNMLYYNQGTIYSGPNSYSMALDLYLQDSTNFTYGDNYLFVQTDYTNVVQESNEDDNLAYTKIFINNSPSYDLSIQNMRLGTDSALNNNQSIRVSCSVVNSGTTYITSSYMAYFVSNDTLLDNDDLYLGHDGVSSLYAGNQSNEYMYFSTPDSLIGEYYIICKADYENYISESDETNNIAYRKIKIIDEETLDGIDVAIIDADIPDTIPYSNSTSIEYSAWLYAQESTSVNLTVYLSTDSVLDITDLQNEVYSTNLYLSPFITLTTNATCYLPQELEQGKYYLIIKADGYNLITENDETNNVLIQPFYLDKSGSTNNFQLDNLEITDLILNNGNTMQGTFQYRSTNDVAGIPVKLSVFLADTGSAIFPSNPIYIDTLAVTSTYYNTHNFSFQLPDTLSEDLYTITFGLSNLGSDFVKNPYPANYGSALMAIRATDLDYELTQISLNSPYSFRGSSLAINYDVVNLGTSQSLTTELSAYLSTDASLSGDDIALGSTTLTGLGIQTPYDGSFSVTIPSNTAFANYQLLVVVDAADEISESNETNNLQATEIEIIPSGANLVIESASLSLNRVVTNQSTTITCQIANTGNQSAGYSYLGYYLSTDTVWDEDDTYLSNDYVSSMSSGYSYTESYSYYPPSSLDTGNYYILLKADYQNYVTELNEDDNITYLALEIIAPDYDFEINQVNQNDTVFVVSGRSSSIELMMRNNGSSPFSNYLSIGKYLSTDDMLNPIEDSYLGSTNTSLYSQNGQLDYTSISYNIPSTIANGTYYGFLKADSQNEWDETDETNNIYRFPVKVIEPNVDLIISDFTLTDTLVSSGNYVRFNMTVENQGNTSTDGSFYVSFYLSEDAVYDAGDNELDSYYISSMAGQTSRNYTNSEFYFSTWWDYGDYYVLAIVDGYDYVDEVDEDNNIVYTPVTLAKPEIDLTVSIQSINSFTFRVGDYIDISCVVENLGRSRSNSSDMGYFLSTDNQYQASDIMLGTDYVSSLSQNDKSYESLYTSIPYLTSGNYYLLLVADYPNYIEEINELNNVDATLITVTDGTNPVTVDYAVSASNPQYTADSLMVDITIQNLGTYTSPLATYCHIGFTEHEYLEYGQGNFTKIPIYPIPVNGDTTIHYSGKIPSGNYNYFVVEVDSARYINDINRSNNFMYFELEERHADLGIEVPLLVPVQTAIPGEESSISYAVYNSGNARSGSAQLSYILSTDQIVDVSDKVLGTVSIPNIESNSTIIDSSLIQIPATTQPGSYALILVLTETNLDPASRQDDNLAYLFYAIKSATGIQEQNTDAIQLYPNPAISSINISSDIEITGYQIYSRAGKLVLEGKLNESQKTIQLREFKPGIYFLNMQTEGGDIIKPFRIQ